MCDTATWVTAGATILLACVAVFVAVWGDWAQSKIWKPKLIVRIIMGQPDCLKTNFYRGNQVIGDVYFLRLWIENKGNVKAGNAEVYAKELRRKRPDGGWEIFPAFPGMNLRWADSHETYFPVSPGMGKHCDLGHISNPSIRREVGDERPSLELSSDQTSLSFDLRFPPPSRAHIIGPDLYRLDILVAAENHRPIPKTIELDLTGKWYNTEDEMFKDGVGVRIL